MRHRVWLSALGVGFLLAMAFGAGFYLRVIAEQKGLLAEVDELRIELRKAKDRSAKNGNLFVSGLAGSATDATESGSPDNRKNFYLEANRRFIFVDLKAMTITLYREDGASTTLPILTKGRDGSWWETPSGNYSVMLKQQNHFSSIGKVWMPWSIQFYGNFFIHGWPYYEGGEPVPQSFSGGCIRLSTEDAKTVYDFAEKDMPLIVDDSEVEFAAVPVPLELKKNVAVPNVSAKAFVVTDLTGKDVLLERTGDEVLPVASLTKLMTAVVASELIYLERAITIKSSMLTASIQSYGFTPGEKYAAFDLLYPLLMQSSNGAASALAAFTGEAEFVRAMNSKAQSLGMEETKFVDPAGLGEGNISSARDLTRLARYILSKRNFILSISKGENYLRFGPLKLGAIKNFNEFASDSRLIGMKNGDTEAARQTMLTLWELAGAGGDKRTVGVVVLGSENRVADTEALLGWIDGAYGFK